MPVYIRREPVTSGEATAGEKTITASLPPSGFLEAVEVDGEDDWLRYNVWIWQYQENQTCSLITEIAKAHLSVICNIKLEPKMYLVGNFQGILTAGNKAHLAFTCSDGENQQ